MPPISAQEKTMKYRSMMSEQKKRYVREENRERKSKEKENFCRNSRKKKKQFV